MSLLEDLAGKDAGSFALTDGDQWRSMERRKGSLALAPGLAAAVASLHCGAWRRGGC